MKIVLQRGSFFSWWCVSAYFLGVIFALGIYIIFPNAVYEPEFEAMVIKVSAFLVLFPISLNFLMTFPQVRINVSLLLKKMPIVLLIVPISLISLLVGLIHENQVRFVIGDSYKLMTLPIGVLAGMVLPLYAVMRAFVVCGIVFILMFIFLALILRAGETSILGIGTYHLLIPLCALPWIDSKANWKHFALLAMVLVAIALGLKRSTMAILPLLMGWLFVTERNARPAIFFVAIIGAGMAAVYSDEVQLLSALFDRVSSTYDGEGVDPSSGSRIQEVKSSWKHMQDVAALGSIQVALFGLGSGATYSYDSEDLRLNEISENSNEIHNIHFTPMTLVFRHGILPAIIIFGAYIKCLQYCIQVRRKNIERHTRNAAMAIFLFGTVLLIASLSGFTIVGELMFPVLMGALIRKQDNMEKVYINYLPHQQESVAATK